MNFLTNLYQLIFIFSSLFIFIHNPLWACDDQQIGCEEGRPLHDSGYVHDDEDEHILEANKTNKDFVVTVEPDTHYVATLSGMEENLDLIYYAHIHNYRDSNVIRTSRRSGRSNETVYFHSGDSKKVYFRVEPSTTNRMSSKTFDSAERFNFKVELLDVSFVEVDATSSVHEQEYTLEAHRTHMDFSVTVEPETHYAAILSYTTGIIQQPDMDLTYYAGHQPSEERVRVKSSSKPNNIPEKILFYSGNNERVYFMVDPDLSRNNRHSHSSDGRFIFRIEPLNTPLVEIKEVLSVSDNEYVLKAGEALITFSVTVEPDTHYVATLSGMEARFDLIYYSNHQFFKDEVATNISRQLFRSSEVISFYSGDSERVYFKVWPHFVNLIGFYGHLYVDTDKRFNFKVELIDIPAEIETGDETLTEIEAKTTRASTN